MEEVFRLAISQTPTLLVEAMRRPVRRRRSRVRLPRIEIDGEGGRREGFNPQGEGGTPPNSHNNYLARTRHAKRTGKVGLPGVTRAKPGAPFGNRNAAKPVSAELRSFKAKADALIARMKAAIAAAEAIMTARPRRRITSFITERDGVVLRVRAVMRIKTKQQAARRDANGISPNVLAGRQDRPEPVASRRQPSYSGGRSRLSSAGRAPDL